MHLSALSRAAFVAAFLSVPASAATVFSQDFEGGLGAGESLLVTSPGFGLTQDADLGNGSFGVGHTQNYANGDNSFTDAYILLLDLNGVSDPTLAFDYSFFTSNPDEFGVLINDVAPSVISGINLNTSFDFGREEPAAAGRQDGRAVFDLGVFAGQSDLTLQIGLAPNPSIVATGFFLDNVVVQGTIAAVPLPASLPLFLAGLFGFGWIARRRARLSQAM